MPFIFLFVLIVIFLLLTSIHVLNQVLAEHIEAGQITIGFILSAFPFAFLYALPASVLLAYIFIFFKMLKTPGYRFFTVIFVAGAAFVVLAAGMIFFTAITPKGQSERKTVEQIILPGKFYNAEKATINTGAIDNNTLSNTLVFSPGSMRTRMAFYRNGVGRISGNIIRLSLSGDGREMISLPVGNPYRSAGSNDFFTSEFFSAYGDFVRDLIQLVVSGGIGFYIYCFAFSFFFMTTGVFMRISKWPLFNLCFMFFIITGVFFLYRLYKNILLIELDKLMKGITLSSMVPAVALIITGALLFLIDILFIPAGFEKKETAGA
ncbi:MAG: hypothetical protein JW881_05925 [Spirochaetales bacterium]|nr:hypothetical protein [Spirochaetales bacterium]